MVKIARFPGDVQAFASQSQGTGASAERTVFGATTESDTLEANVTTQFLRGWRLGVDANGFPPEQYFNALGYTLSQFIAYLHQMGIPEWDDEQEYHEHSIVISPDGVLRQSLSNLNIGNNPDTDTTNWTLVGSGGGGGGGVASIAANGINGGLLVTFGDSTTTTVTINAASFDTRGAVQLATSTEVLAGSSTTSAVSPATLASRTATTERGGMVELATNTEVQTGIAANRAVTPSSLSARTATTSRTGLAEIATQSEVNAGSDSTRYVTPSTLSNYTGISTGIVTLRATRTTNGTFSVTGLTVGKPLFMTISSGASGTPVCTYVTNTGTNDGKALGTTRYVMRAGSNTDTFAGSSAVFIPTSTSVSFTVENVGVTNATVRFYQ